MGGIRGYLLTPTCAAAVACAVARLTQQLVRITVRSCKAAAHPEMLLKRAGEQHGAEGPCGSHIIHHTVGYCIAVSSRK
jgi:hypothetical protein